MHIPRVSKSSTATATSISVTASRASQLEPAAGQRQQGSFVGLLTTIHTPESALIPATYHQQDELGLLPETDSTQITTFEALASQQTATFDDHHQEQSASSLSLSNEPSRSQRSSQPVEDVVPIVRKEPSPDPTDKWITMSRDKKRPYQCGYVGCGRKYSHKVHLQTHFVTHTGDSKLRCYFGDCTGTVTYRNTRTLTRHIHASHTFERLFGCELCDKRFRCEHHLKRHKEQVHLIKSKKKSPERHDVSKSSSAASTSTKTSGVSQPELAAGQRQQGSYVAISTAVHTPESTHNPKADQQFSGLRLLANVSTSQINPFEALAKHQTVIFDDEAVTTRIAGGPDLRSFQHLARQSPDPTDTDKWIIVDKSQERPYRCGYPGCKKSYSKRYYLRGHFVIHTGKSKFQCPHPECAGEVYFRDRATLKRHMVMHTSEKPFQCDICERRFGRKDQVKSHRKNVHGDKEEKKSPKRKKK